MKPNTRPSIRRMAAFSLALLCAATARAGVVLNESFPVGTGAYTAGAQLNGNSTLVVKDDYSYGFADGYGWSALGYNDSTAFTQQGSRYLANATGLSLPQNTDKAAYGGSACPNDSYTGRTTLRKMDSSVLSTTDKRYFRFLMQVGETGAANVDDEAPNVNGSDNGTRGQSYPYGAGIVGVVNAGIYDQQLYFFYRANGFVIEFARDIDDSSKFAIYLATEKLTTDQCTWPANHQYSKLLADAKAGQTYLCIAELAPDSCGTWTVSASALPVTSGEDLSFDGEFVASVDGVPLVNATYGSYVTIGSQKKASDVFIDEIAIGTALGDVVPVSTTGLRKPKIESLSATNASTESAAAETVVVNLSAVATNIISAAEAVAVETTVTVYYATSEELLASNPKSATATTSEAGTVSVALSGLAWETKYYCYAVASATLDGETKSDTSDIISFKTPVEGNASILFRDGFEVSDDGYTTGALLGQNPTGSAIFGYGTETVNDETVSARWCSAKNTTTGGTRIKIVLGGQSYPGNFPAKTSDGAVSPSDSYDAYTLLRKIDTEIFPASTDKLYFSFLMNVGTKGAMARLTNAPNAAPANDNDTTASGQDNVFGVGILNTTAGNAGTPWRCGNRVNGFLFEFAQCITNAEQYAIYAVTEAHAHDSWWYYQAQNHCYTEIVANAKVGATYLVVCELTRTGASDTTFNMRATALELPDDASEKVYFDKYSFKTVNMTTGTYTDSQLKVTTDDSLKGNLETAAAAIPLLDSAYSNSAKAPYLVVTGSNGSDVYFDEFLITTDLASIVAMRSPGFIIILR